MAVLPDRGVVSVTGEDARKLLAGIITNDIDLIDTQPMVFAGLLSPQGKVLFEFFVVKADGGFLLDVTRDQAAHLVKRLAMYRLRAKAEIAERTADWRVLAVWDGAPPPAVPCSGGDDPRSTALGRRLIAAASAVIPGGPMSPAEYHAHRIALGIPEGGKDYDFGDAFPHEVNFDLMNGVSFDKGCYVGQEIVARMQHRGTVRKRIVRVTGAAELPETRPDILIGDVVIGRLGSVAGRQGLAMLRLDRAIEAIDKGVPITTDGIPLDIDGAMIERQRRLMAEKAGLP